MDTTPLSPAEAPPVHVRGRRLAVLLAGPLASPTESKDRWLVQLRWLALLGMTATVAVAHVLVPAIRLGPIVVLLGVVLTTNLGWMAFAHRPRAYDGVAAQIALDSCLVAALLWFSGGIGNPFAVFLTFQVALAGALCNGRTAARIGLLALISIAVLAWADPLPLDTAPLGRTHIETLGRLWSLLSVVLFLGLFALVYAQRLADLREAGARNERLAMLGRMAGGMSHELSTPLGTILIGSRDLATILRDGDPEAAGLAITIAEEAERASDVIGLLRGQIRPDQRAEIVDLSELVPAITARELDRLKFEGQRVISAARPVLASVLRIGLRQVLRNLLANAVHATAEAEPLAKRRRIEVEVLTRGEAAEVRVTDNGCGFSPAIVARLGEPFQTTKEDDGGLGLGLYVSSMLAQRMNASLRAEDVEGGGARVVLTLTSGLPAGPDEADGEARATKENRA